MLAEQKYQAELASKVAQQEKILTQEREQARIKAEQEEMQKALNAEKARQERLVAEEKARQ